ncbi:unnamed protein product [Camellia sinensis]
MKAGHGVLRARLCRDAAEPGPPLDFAREVLGYEARHGAATHRAARLPSSSCDDRQLGLGDDWHGLC